MNFFKKLFNKKVNVKPEDIVYSFADTLAESEDVFILTESLLEYDKKEIEKAFDKQIAKEKSFVESSGIGGVIGSEAKRRLQETRALKVHIENFVTVPPYLKEKVEEANKLFEGKLEQFGNRNDAFKEMPDWAQKLYVLAAGNNLDKIGEDLKI